MGGYYNTQMILVMDDAILPEHIKQTFRLREAEKGWASDIPLLLPLSLGEEIDLTVGGYVIVYANNPWHRDKAEDLYHQIKSLRKDAQIIWLPVEYEEKPSASPLFKIDWGGSGNFTIPTIP